LTTFVIGMDPAGHCTKSLTPLDPWRGRSRDTPFPARLARDGAG